MLLQYQVLMSMPAHYCSWRPWMPSPAPSSFSVFGLRGGGSQMCLQFFMWMTMLAHYRFLRETMDIFTCPKVTQCHCLLGGG